MNLYKKNHVHAGNGFLKALPARVDAALVELAIVFSEEVLEFAVIPEGAPLRVDAHFRREPIFFGMDFPVQFWDFVQRLQVGSIATWGKAIIFMNLLKLNVRTCAHNHSNVAVLLQKRASQHSAGGVV